MGESLWSGKSRRYSENALTIHFLRETLIAMTTMLETLHLYWIVKEN